MKTMTLSSHSIDGLILAALIHKKHEGWVNSRPLYYKWWSSKVFIDLVRPDDPSEVAQNKAEGEEDMDYHLGLKSLPREAMVKP